MQMEENGSWKFGQFAVSFQREEGKFISKYLIYLQKVKELLKIGKSYALFSFKGRFLMFRMYHNFANLFSQLSESTFYKGIIKFQ